jgi:dCTP deaminase
MICNGTELYAAQPVSPIVKTKIREHGVSYGMSEAGYDLRIKQSVTLHPLKRFALASTIERFDMPKDLVAIVHDKSTWARRGLSVFNTVIEPDWRGWLTLELVYHGWKPIRIPAGAGIAQAIFHRIEQPASYGGGKYQDQEDKPVGAKG